MISQLELALFAERGIHSISQLSTQDRIWFDYANNTNARGTDLVRTIEANIDGSLSGLQILDIGCGYGGTAIAAGMRGGHVLGVDISQRNLRMAEINLKDFHDIDVCFKNIDVTDDHILKELGKFDLIIADNVIEHVKSPNGLISAASSLLNVGGGLYLTAPNARSVGMVRSECHYGLPGISLLPPYLAEKVLNQNKAIPFQPYDVSFYFDFCQYLEMFNRYGLNGSSLLPEIVSKEEIDALAIEILDVAHFVKDFDYKDVKELVNEVVYKWIEEYNSDANFMAREDSAQIKNRIAGRIKRDYGYDLWYFFCKKA